MSFNDLEFQRIEAYTLQLEQIPLEEFETSAEARATFIRILKEAKDDIPWIVYLVHDVQENLEAENLEEEDDMEEEYRALDEAFIARGISVRDRFAACYARIQEIVLHEGHEELDELDIKDAFADAVCVEDALAEELTHQ
jgi:hypothetical protein